jgi:flagellar protein FlaJ
MAPEVPEPGFIKKLILSGQLVRLVILICTLISVAIFVLFAILSMLGIVTFATVADFLIFALLSGTGIYGTYVFLHARRIHKIDTIFPDFVRDLAESRRAGMTFTKAILFAARGNYGILTPEIQKIAQQVSWGSSVNEALTAFATRVDTKLIRRTISLIIESSKSGGNVADVLDAASRDARELKLIESERRAGMMSFVAVLYVGIGVFLLIIIVLCKSILPSMLGEGAQQAANAYGSIGVGGAGGITQKGVLDMFFYASIVQSFGMGIVTGVFEGGDFKSGIKHTFIMMLITWLIFKLFITGI